MPPIEAIIAPLEAELKLAIIAPLEAELKLARSEIGKHQEDNRALDRLTKSKEAALLDAERSIQTAMAKAALVDDLQNKNQELMKQIEICQVLSTHYHPLPCNVLDASRVANKLEDVVLAGGSPANAVRDYQRKFQEMNEERKTLDRELACAKGEMQQLRDKLAISDRAAKSEAQLKDKFQLRLKVLEETLRGTSSSSVRSTPERRSMSNGRSRRQSLGGADSLQKFGSNGFLPKKSPSSHMKNSFIFNSTSVLKSTKGTSRSFDGGTRSLDRGKALLNGPENYSFNKACDEAKESESHLMHGTKIHRRSHQVNSLHQQLKTMSQGFCTICFRRK
ncbi:unnamed protein product [Eruca vesicaria subsp. sativa]|uniref:Uncharacterized protein n=1 Tax=Eruca vesicaria subsp. sativa TaxID=29727 RepID=A0ABC8JKK9_ERUVS|nr:unnamed protein product [Eruca vesicaria subsp. sativa]